MKKFLTLSVFSLGCITLVFAQPVLNFETHALRANVDNPMSYCVYQEAGPDGANITWDFSNLQFSQSFTGYLKNAVATQIGSTFTRSNTELAEFDSRFYFHIDRDKIEQYGYSSSDGKFQTRYDIPFVKMKYPFAYGDIFTGVFTGATYYSGVKAGDVNGNYVVEADAYGKLILPGNTVYENTLRVRTEKKYTTALNRGLEEVDIVTYRWYNATFRYPLLVLTQYTVKSGGSATINYQAAYNNNALNVISPIVAESIVLYPNPAEAYLAVEFDIVAPGDLNFIISDASGKIVRSFTESITQGGKHYTDLTNEINGLMPGTYNLGIKNGNEIVNRSFTLIQ